MEVELLPPLRLSCHLEVFAWDYWQLVAPWFVRDVPQPSSVLCTAAGAGLPLSARRAVPNPILSKHDCLQSPVSSSFWLCLL